ncbi:UTP--glucose-1-phosphate uridylyltransferase GalU [Hazenella sp. IB182353]|uniref:UTP--glucose-1-phosphate uridylyltransferase GalU n=1 Tax=Polycladospora coralii TaxID=2771432 RepID=UPI001745E51F|nr:UTP--glucose-1-phosphate uridylyltransferase GalU [Polycladospora coralii]MBS7528899.1 UTP--glucose-1-phosphate uridylyltransferase GalU [Polycladospora coralii]
MKKVRKAIIPAAGLGTRFLPATKALPKEMLPIIDKPTIQFIVEEAIASGIERIMIVTGRHKRAIEDHFDHTLELENHLLQKGKKELLDMVLNISDLTDITYVRQKQPLGLGHAILCARNFIEDEPFAVLLGDDIIESSRPTLNEMIDVYEQEQTSVLGIQQVALEEVSKYGIIDPISSDLPRTYQVGGLVEKPSMHTAPSNLAVIGRYVLEPDIFKYLEKINMGKGGEIQLTDALCEMNLKKQMMGLQIQGKRYDVGDKAGYIKATIDYAIARPDLADEIRKYLQEKEVIYL